MKLAPKQKKFTSTQIKYMGVILTQTYARTVLVNCKLSNIAYNFLKPILSISFPNINLDKLLQIAPRDAAHVRIESSMPPILDPYDLKTFPKNVLK